MSELEGPGEARLDGEGLSERLRGAPGSEAREAMWAKAVPQLSPDASRLLASVADGFDRWAERAARALAQPDIGNPLRAARTLAAALVKNPEVLACPDGIEAAVDLAGSSDWAARLLAARPQWLSGICRGAAALEGRPPAPAAQRYGVEASKIVRHADGNTELFETELRRFRTQEALRIALRELRGADVRSTAAELAEFASVALQAALDHHYPKLVESVGPLSPPCRHLVVGLGKLGGRELNFSSDIDVLYLYEHDEGGTEHLSNHQFFVRLFERVTNSLSRLTEHGRVFRVDIDLRPEGRTGALCNSLASLERYYETWGRTWERAVWIKARPVAGDLDLFTELAQFIRPFVYRSTRDLAAVEGVLEMKGQIDAQRRRARLNTGGFDLKLGKGGIREIEFFAQGQQLLFGGRDPRLRCAGTLAALHALEVAGRINPRHREMLANAYVFLRRVEHRVQLAEDRQTHKLPAGPALSELARSLACGSSRELRSVLESHAEGVHTLFVGLMGAVDDEPPTPKAVEQLLDATTAADAQLQVLAELGSRSPHSARANLAAAVRIPRSPFHPAAPERMARLGRQLLADCLRSPDVDRALKHLPDLLRAVLYHGAYLEQLNRADLRRGVARVLGSSDLLARILVSNPPLLSGVLFAGRLPGPEALAESVAECIELDEPERTLVKLRVLKQEEILRVAMGELAGAVTPAETQLRLTHLAERILEGTFRLALLEAEQRYGPPQDPGAALVLLAGGTLGARELGYRSDVDLSALYVGEGETKGGERSPVAISELYTRVIQRMLSFLTLRMPQGDLYPVDMRLRPSGSQGALVTSLENFRKYHSSGRARLWERQALVRTRVLFGPSALRERVEQAVGVAAYGHRYGQEDGCEIDAMRNRLARERGRRPGAGSLDLKFGPGGLVELEFLVQHYLLLHVPSHSDLKHPNTRTALERLGAIGVIDSGTARRLRRADERLRRTLNWMRVIHDEMLNRVNLGEEQIRPLALALGYEGPEAQGLLLRDLDADRNVVRSSYLSGLGLEDPRH